MKKKVIIVSWHGENELGGVELVTHYMHQAWNEEYDVTIVDFDMVKQSNMCRLPLGLHYSIDAWTVSFYVNRYVKKIKKETGSENVIVVTQGYNAPGVKADVAFAHGTMRGNKLAIYNSHKWYLSQLYEKLSWNRAQKVVAVSDHVKQEAHNFYGVDSGKIEVIQNCIDTNAFFPIDRQDDGICTIVFCGRLNRGKGLDKLRTLAKAVEFDPRFRLIIATPTGRNVKTFSGLTKTEILIRLKKTEMNQFYNRGNIMYFPSLYEGFELATVESLSAGIPVASNRIGAAGDWAEAGRAGVNILSGDIEKDLEMMYIVATEYKDIWKRKQLHQQVEKYLNYDVYKERLRFVLRRI